MSEKLYEHMQEVAKANGFESITQAIAEAVRFSAMRPANDAFRDDVWTCSCNSQLYNLTKDGAACFVCGKVATEWANSF